MSYLKKDNKKKRSVAIYLIIIGITLLLLALIIHPYDEAYKNFIQNCSLKRVGGTFNSFLDLIRVFGKGDVIILIVVAMGAKGLRKAGVRIAIAMIIMAILVNSLKYTVHRERPNGSNNVSFPSGDTATTSAFLATASAEYPSISASFILAPAVGFVRTYDNYHYLSDVIAGLAFGIISAGLAYFVNIKPFKLMEQKIKPRLYALATIVMILIMFLPEAIRGGGERYNFTYLFGPALFIWLVASYSQLFAFKHVQKDSFFSRIFVFRRNINNYFANKLSYNIFHKSYGIIILLISILAILYCWFIINFEPLLFSISGLFLGIITSVLIIINQNKKAGNRRKIVHTLINSILILFIFFFITFLPSVVKYNKEHKIIVCTKLSNG